VKTPRFSDMHRFQQPYADAKASMEPGYLAARFAAIREQQARAEAERARIVAPMRKVASK